MYNPLIFYYRSRSFSALGRGQLSFMHSCTERCKYFSERNCERFDQHKGGWAYHRRCCLPIFPASYSSMISWWAALNPHSSTPDSSTLPRLLSAWVRTRLGAGSYFCTFGSQTGVFSFFSFVCLLLKNIHIIQVMQEVNSCGKIAQDYQYQLPN